MGKEIRKAFIAEPGNTLVVGDYSQIELRILAHLSKDPVLIDAFQKDQDIHARTVIEMFGEARLRCGVETCLDACIQKDWLANRSGGSRESWWTGMDSNHRRREPTRLQRVPFSRSGTRPQGALYRLNGRRLKQASGRGALNLFSGACPLSENRFPLFRDMR